MPDHWVVWYRTVDHGHEIVYRGTVMECLAYMAGVDDEARRHGVVLERDGAEIRHSDGNGATQSWVVAPEQNAGDSPV
ncbi:hypothetical protein BJY24_007519 [Nocardia transvalensis]|uniref:Uncharacterized protein n=1 Tax=Nocardia transvalensis TaxID=37333 RepID=A0A7W9PLZ2_9NOCA|nr:hypothetical protein [Nocardia transvalensis]MBB5918607.1 hypothetical protein [Nocardia transvalensis]